MPNPYGAPETDVQTLHSKLKNGDEFILMDVREVHELHRAQLNAPQTTIVPLSLLAREQLAGIPEQAADKDAEIIVMCHHGVRSAQVTVWLRNNGWNNVVSLAGGIDAYAKEIDPTVGLY